MREPSVSLFPIITPPKGVQFTVPPSHLLSSINEAVERAAIAADTPGKNVAIIGVVNQSGMNAAIVVRAGDTWKVKAYAGKEWGGDWLAGVEVLALL